MNISAQVMNEDKVYPLSVLEYPPVFPECQNIENSYMKDCFEKAVNTLINQNLKYPESAFDKKLGGRVLVNFKVNKNGEVFDIFPRGTDSSLETEAKRVVSLIPKLIPGKIDNKPVITSYSFPIDFVLLTTYGIYEIEVKAGSNIYSKPDSKSNILTYTQINNSFNARERGDFWEVELEFNETIFGYVSKDNILNINQVAVKNDDLNSINISIEKTISKEEEIVEEEIQEKKQENKVLVTKPLSEKLNNSLEVSKPIEDEKLNETSSFIEEELVNKNEGVKATISSNNKKVILSSDNTWKYLNPMTATIKSNGEKVLLINDRYWIYSNTQVPSQEQINNEPPLKETKETISRDEAFKRLRDLKSLFDDGILTKDEYEEAAEKLKKIILE